MAANIFGSSEYADIDDFPVFPAIPFEKEIEKPAKDQLSSIVLKTLKLGQRNVKDCKSKGSIPCTSIMIPELNSNDFTLMKQLNSLENIKHLTKWMSTVFPFLKETISETTVTRTEENYQKIQTK